jgi:uncharacterized protein YbjQ (UPF0145 family)
MSDSESTSVMLVVTTSTIAGYRIVETIGAAVGVVTFFDPVDQARAIQPQRLNDSGVWEVIQNVGEPPWEFGRNPQDHQDVEDQGVAGRDYALRTLKENATSLGANAVVDLRFDSCLVTTQYSTNGRVAYGVREIVAYGTAVVVKKAKSE